MGGRKRDEDKSTLLVRARAERAAREEERKRKASAGESQFGMMRGHIYRAILVIVVGSCEHVVGPLDTIQRWWRGRACAARTRRSMRSTWDSNVSKLQQVKARTSTHNFAKKSALDPKGLLK